MSYEELLIQADNDGLLVKEAPLESSDGRCKGRRIAIRQDISTLAKKADILAEELGHYHTTVGNITNLDSSAKLKQERRARLYAYNLRIGLLGLIRAYSENCTNLYEMSECLGVSEEFLSEALECYRETYGKGTIVDNYFIQFEPNLQVYAYQAMD